MRQLGYVIFGMKRRKKPKNMLEITIYKAGMMWQFERISGCHTSRRIYGRYISSIWRLSSSHDTHSSEPTIKISKFMVQWPRTPATLFRSLHIWSGCYVTWAWAEPIWTVCADAHVEWRPLKGGATVHRQPLSTLQETYNSRLRERYEDNPSTHPDFDLDLWMKVGSSGGPDKNWVYGLSNTMYGQ